VIKLKLLEDERVRLVWSFAKEHGIIEKAVFTKLTDIAGDDSFQSIRLQLVSLLQSIMEFNGFNRILIERSAAVVQNALNFLSSIGVVTKTKNSGTLYSRQA